MRLGKSRGVAPFLAATFCLLAHPVPLQAVTYTWDPLPKAVAGDGEISGGYGTWNTTLRNWTTNGGVTNVPWGNGSGNAAIFQGKAGIIIPSSSDFTLNSIRFESDGYLVRSSLPSFGFILAGASPTIDIPNADHQATIAAVLKGTAGFTLSGAGTLRTSLDSSFTGTINIQSNATLILGTNYAPFTNVGFAGSGTLRLAGGNDSDGLYTAYSPTGNSSGFSGKIQLHNANTEFSLATNAGTASIETLGFSLLKFNSTTGGNYTNNITLNSVGVVNSSNGNAGALQLLGNNPLLSGTITLAQTSRITGTALNGNIRGTIQELGGSRALEIGGVLVESTYLTLSGTTTHTGGTIVSGFSSIGSSTTLSLDYSAVNGSKFDNSSTLTFQGKTILTLTGATGNHTEVVGQFNNLGSLTINRSDSNTAKIALGAMKNSGVLNVAALNLATTSTANNALGYLPGVIFNNTQLAANDGSGNIVASPVTYSDVTRLNGGTQIIPAAPIVRVVDGTGTAANLTIGAGTTDIGSLFQSASGGNITADLTDGTLRFAAQGEIIAQSTRTLTLQNGVITAGGADNIPGTLAIHGTNAMTTINSAIHNNGAGAVTVVTGGNITLGNAANSFSGGLTIAGGTTSVATMSALGTNNTVTMDGGKLAVTAANMLIDRNFSLTANGGHIATASSNTSSTISGTISGSGTLTLSGTGTTVISAANSYTGGTIIEGSPVRVNTNTSALGSGPITIRSGPANGGQLYMTGGVWTNDFTISGEYQDAGAIMMSNATISGNIVLEGESGVRTLNPSVITGVISGDYNFRKTGTSRLTLTGANTYTGSTFIDGTLAIVGTGSLNNGDYDGDFQNFGTFSYESSKDQILRGSLYTGGGNLVKSGSSTLTIMGDVGGTVTVNSGKLVLNGTSSSATTNATVHGGTLGGAGSLRGTLTINNSGTLSPGNSIESFHVVNAVFNTGSIFDYELTSSNLMKSDLLVANGNVTLNGATINLIDLDTLPGQLPLGSKLTLINYSGTLTGTFAGLPEDTAFQFGNNYWQINYADTTGGNNIAGEQAYSKFVTLTTVAIPEPSTYALTLVLIGLGLIVRKRWNPISDQRL
jgi:fibronectin-binding autotransporter adhesin